jgi:two-component system, NtrC family, response regulator GlrR
MHLMVSRPDCVTTVADDIRARFSLLGESSAFAEVLHAIRRLAPFDAALLIQGETGTGKELVGRALHYLSNRRDGPFIPINCGAIPDSLIETELFGHTRGAFTDAREARDGVIAQARGGTLFLDELEALSPRGQVALLRFLQDQEYRPVGGGPLRHANVRVLGSTNVDLNALAERGEYRPDLLFRLHVLTLQLPPLRARGHDVILLAQAFARRFSQQYHRPEKELHPESLLYLRQHSWPGNIRELENLMLRAVLMSDDAQLKLNAASTPAPVAAANGSVPTQHEVPLTSVSFRKAKARVIAQFERAYIEELLTRTGGNISLAARLSGKERSRLGKLLRKHGLSGASFRVAASATTST